MPLLEYLDVSCCCVGCASYPKAGGFFHLPGLLAYVKTTVEFLPDGNLYGMRYLSVEVINFSPPRRPFRLILRYMLQSVVIKKAHITVPNMSEWQTACLWL